MTSVTIRQRSKRNLSIEGLRGFLAFSVLLFHVYEMGAKAGFYPKTENETVAASGIYIVCIFFCVSGFLITQSLIAKDDIASFFRNRVVRIYPVFLMLHLIIFGVGVHFKYEWMSKLAGHPWAYAGHFVSNLLFLPGLLALPLAQKNAWSLSYEAAFYVVAAALYAAARSKNKLIVAALIVLCAASIWLRPLLQFFVVGLIAYAAEGRIERRVRWLDILGIACFIGGIFLFPVSVYGTAVLVLVFFIAVVEKAGLIGRFLQKPPIVFLGKISYSLYLVHPFVLDPIRRLLESQRFVTDPLMAGIIFILAGPALAVTASSLSFTLIEQKFTKALLGRRDNAEISGKGPAGTATMPMPPHPEAKFW